MPTPAQAELKSLRHAVVSFVTSPAGAARAAGEDKEAWPVAFTTEPFDLEGVIYDNVEMDESFVFWLSSSTGGDERKVGSGEDSDVTAMCAAVRKAIARDSGDEQATASP